MTSKQEKANVTTRKALLTIFGGLGLVLLVWLGFGAFIWSRNQIPPLNISPREALPQGNVYNQYLQCVRGVQGREALGGLRIQAAPNTAQTQALLTRNQETLQTFHSLIGKPAMAIDLEPKGEFVAAIEFPPFTQLLTLEAAAQKPGEALKTLLDGLTFCEDMARGGATLHLTIAHLAAIPIFQAFPQHIKPLSASEAKAGADRLAELLKQQYPLSAIFRNEQRVRVEQMERSLKPGAGRIFRFDFPKSSFEWEYLRKPKGEAVVGLAQYLDAWAKEADKSPHAVSPPALPPALTAMTNDETLQPEVLMREMLRFQYRRTRLHLLYTALRLEQYRKMHGSYPTALDVFRQDASFSHSADPFAKTSTDPLVYRREGAGYQLYSVGPNGKDDGGTPMREGRLRSDQSGDLLLQPQMAGNRE